MRLNWWKMLAGCLTARRGTIASISMLNSVLNADTGALLYTVHPARNALPAAIAVDSQAERLIEADVVLKG